MFSSCIIPGLQVATNELHTEEWRNSFTCYRYWSDDGIHQPLFSSTRGVFFWKWNRKTGYKLSLQHLVIAQIKIFFFTKSSDTNVPETDISKGEKLSRPETDISKGEKLPRKYDQL